MGHEKVCEKVEGLGREYRAWAGAREDMDGLGIRKRRKGYSEKVEVLLRGKKEWWGIVELGLYEVSSVSSD